MKIFHSKTKKFGKRIETGLLMENKIIVVPLSKNMALGRLYWEERKDDRYVVLKKVNCEKINNILLTNTWKN